MCLVHSPPIRGLEGLRRGPPTKIQEHHQGRINTTHMEENMGRKKALHSLCGAVEVYKTKLYRRNSEKHVREIQRGSKHGKPEEKSKELQQICKICGENKTQTYDDNWTLDRKGQKGKYGKSWERRERE